MKFAVLDDSNVVVNVIVADSMEIAQEASGGATCVPYEYNQQVSEGVSKTAFIHWKYDSETGNFIRPALPEVTVEEKLASSGLTVNELKQLLGL